VDSLWINKRSVSYSHYSTLNSQAYPQVFGPNFDNIFEKNQSDECQKHQVIHKKTPVQQQQYIRYIYIVVLGFFQIRAIFRGISGEISAKYFS